jgi:exopolyphosphatase/guanosine-5'-triphosphate,3'-diphosphate pyrophosphatase
LPPASSSPEKSSGGAAPQANTSEAKSQERKKKRRRRSRGGGEPRLQETQNPNPQPKPDNQRHPSKQKHARNRRRLQGRPLPPQEAPKAEQRPPEQQPKPQAVQENAPNPPSRRSQYNDPQHDGLYAALDLGTNNCRLLVAQPTRPGQFRVVDAFSRIVRLGEGLGASGMLSEDAMDRAVEALKVCASKLAAKQIRRMRLIATEACRAAGNGEEFLARVVAEAGLELEIINRETEARLAVSGCASLVGREARSAVLFDIGGGSSEIAVLQINGIRSPGWPTTSPTGLHCRWES